MNRNTVVASVALGLGAFAAGAVAEESVRWIGAAPSHRSIERFDMSVGVTAGQLPRRPERFEEDREVLNVPSHFGALVGMTSTGDGATTVLWFKDGDGSLRNAVVRDAAARSLKIQYAVSSRYEADARDDRR